MRRLLVLALLSAAIIVPSVSAQAQEQPAELLVTLSQTVVVAGDQITVEGSGWPAGQVMSVTTCGNLAIRGSQDCNPQSSATPSTDIDGNFVTQLQIFAPPSDCPCVVHVTALGSTGKVDIPIDLVGHPVSDLIRPAVTGEPVFTVTVTDVAGAGPWLSWVGASATRDVTVEVANVGPVPVSGAQGLIKVGRSPNPSEVVAAMAIPDLLPGATVEVVQSVSLPSPNFGEYWIAATVDAFPTQVTGSASTTAWPLGFLAAIVLLLQIPVFKARNWTRARFAEVSEAGAYAQVPPSTLPVVPVATAGLGAVAGAAALSTVELAPDEHGNVPVPIPIAMGATSSWSAQVPISFASTPAGAVPVVTVAFEPADQGSDAPPRIREIVIGGDIELRLRAVAADATIQPVQGTESDTEASTA